MGLWEVRPTRGRCKSDLMSCRTCRRAFLRLLASALTGRATSHCSPSQLPAAGCPNSNQACC